MAPLKTVKVKGLQINPPSGSAFTYETAPELPKLHQNMLIIGARGAGKSTACINLVERMPFDRIFIISPTMRSNRELMKRLKVDPDDVYEDPDDVSCLDDIKSAVEAEAAELDRYRHELKRYKQLMKLLNGELNVPIPDELLELFFHNGDFRPPEHKYNGRPPCCALILDDCLGSNLYGKGIRKLNNMTILHRHIGQLEEAPYRLGLSLFFLLQSYKAQVGGISRPIRHQATSLMVFSLKDEKQLKEISEECSGEIMPETFLQVYKQATDIKHGFLFIDLHPKDNHVSQFRCCLDSFIIPPADASSQTESDLPTSK